MYGYYDNAFEKSNENREFPYNKYHTSGHDLRAFVWELYVDYDRKFKRIDALSGNEISELEKKGYIREIIKNEYTDDILYKKKTNYVWVGKIQD